MVSYKNDFFIFGGHDGNKALNDFWKFDTICNEWELIKESKDTFIDIKNTISKADTFYNSSFEGIRDIPLNCRFSIIVARRVYRHIGKKILEKKDIVNYQKAGKIYVSNFGKVIQTILSLLDLIILTFLKQRKIEKEYSEFTIDKDFN